MVDRFDLDRLTEWQVGVFAAGCARRLAPAADALCWPLARRVAAECVAAAFDGGGRLPALRAEHLERAVRRIAVTGSVDEFGDEMADVLTTGALAVAACRGGGVEDAARAAELACGVWSVLDDATGGNWAVRERQFQDQTLAILTGMPRDTAIALVRALEHDLGTLGRSMDSAGWCAPAPRVEMPGADAWSTDPHSERVAPADRVGDGPSAPAELLVAAGEKACPRDEAGRSRPPFRPGDVLRMECAFESTEVVKVSAYDAYVRWPWPRPHHPGSTQTFPRDPSTDLWTPFQIMPAAAALRPGDPCHVGIAPTVVYALQVWSSRRGENLFSALPTGRTAVGGWSEEAGAIDPYDDPIEMSLLHRAYGFLRPGDIVIDATGRRLAWAPPLVFTDGGGTVHEPVWPLALVAGDDHAARADKVLAETSTGTHARVVAAWERAAGARLPHPDFLKSWFMLPDLRAWPFGR